MENACLFLVTCTAYQETHLNSFSAEFETESTAFLGARRGKLSTWTFFFLSGTINFRLGMLVLVGKVSACLLGWVCAYSPCCGCVEDLHILQWDVFCWATLIDLEVNACRPTAFGQDRLEVEYCGYENMFSWIHRYLNHRPRAKCLAYSLARSLGYFFGGLKKQC